ncbi:MAG TPA: substrate-binding domain-containing protein [Bryobacteraceae bacterium]|nr:substrate-binding domain-containing protein [Bryobacteraceae bacterium]
MAVPILSRREVVSILENEILKGDLGLTGKGSTITTRGLLEILKAHGGVSEATLRRAVSDLSKRGILRAAGRKGLVIEGRSEGVRVDPDRNVARRPIALVVAEIEDLFLSLVLRGLTEQARVRGHHVIIHNSRLNAESELQGLKELLPISAGAILVPVRKHSHVERIRTLRRQYNRPIVCLERSLLHDETNDPDFPLIASDNKFGGALAAQMLIQSLIMTNGSAKGKLYVVGRDTTSGQLERYNGFCERVTRFNNALQGAAFQVQDPFWLRPGDCRYKPLSSNVKTVLELEDPESPFRKALEQAREMPHGRAFGVFCLADSIAITLYGLLTRRGEIDGLRTLPRIPGDLIMVGYDDLFYAEPVGLSTIRQDFEELGRRAVDAVVLGTQSSRLKPEAQDRASTVALIDDL